MPARRSLLTSWSRSQPCTASSFLQLQLQLLMNSAPHLLLLQSPLSRDYFPLGLNGASSWCLKMLQALCLDLRELMAKPWAKVSLSTPEEVRLAELQVSYHLLTTRLWAAHAMGFCCPCGHWQGQATEYWGLRSEGLSEVPGGPEECWDLLWIATPKPAWGGALEASSHTRP